MPGRHPVEAARKSDVEQPGERTPLQASSSLLTKAGKQDEVPVKLLDNPLLWVRTLSKTFSWKLLTVVVVTNHLLKGLVAGGGDEGLVGKPIEFILGGMGVAAGRLQMIKAAAIAPWALKPLVALLSDGVPILGYKKMPYVVVATGMGFCGAMSLGFGYAATIPAVTLGLFFIFLQVSSVDLLVQARQSEEVKQKAESGPQFFTFTWLGINAGQLISAALLGPLIYHGGPRVCYLVAAPFILLVLWPTLCNFLNERPVPVEERGCSGKILQKHPILFFLTLLVGVLTTSLIFATFVLNEAQLSMLAMGCAVMVMSAFMLFVRREIAGPIVFYFFLTMLSFNVDGALFYFYTDTVREFPGGPHFTPYFYTTAMGIATFGGMTVGFLSGETLFKAWSYRSILRVTILLRVLTQLMLVPVLTRQTAAVGISDRVWVLAVMVLDMMVLAWRWIPKQVMSAHIAVKGVEATVLGLTAGTYNLAMILSSYTGGFVLNLFGARPEGQPGESLMFQDLWKAQVVAAVAPCAMLLLLPALIPEKLQTEPLLTQQEDSATHGSAFETMTRSVGQLRQRRQ